MTLVRPRTQRRLSGAPSGSVPHLFLAPAILLFVVLVLLPAAGGVVLSFTDLSLLGAPDFVGWDNYTRIATDQQAIASLGNTFLLAGIVVLGQNLLGLALALALEAAFPGRNFLRVLFLLPAILSPVIIGYLWQYLYSPTGGVNQLLEAVGLGQFATSWLGDPSTALVAVAIATIWQLTGYAMVIYVAGLHGVSEDVLAAAQLDGANSWQRLIHIKLPLIAPAITINLALSLIGGLRLFDQILAMTSGGPGYATETLATVIYKVGFTYGELGYSMALAIVLGLFVAVLATVQVVLTRRAEVNR
jgi:raffinose/stachyose/melibiose transport system permease protein